MAVGVYTFIFCRQNLIAHTSNAELAKLLNDSAMSLIRASTTTEQATQDRFAWSFATRIHSMAPLFDEPTQEPPAEDILSVDAALAQQLYDMQMHHPGFRNDFDRFVLVNGATSVSVDWVSRPVAIRARSSDPSR